MERALEQPDQLVKAAGGVAAAERLGHERDAVGTVAQLVERGSVERDPIACLKGAGLKPCVQQSALLAQPTPGRCRFRR